MSHLLSHVAHAPITLARVAGTLSVCQVEDTDAEELEWFKFQLQGIDAPETAQCPWGLMTAAHLKQLLPKGQAVQVREIERDRDGRTVAEVFLGISP